MSAPEPHRFQVGGRQAHLAACPKAQVTGGRSTGREDALLGVAVTPKRGHVCDMSGHVHCCEIDVIDAA